MIGTSDQSCWLAEACNILLLLLLQNTSKPWNLTPGSVVSQVHIYIYMHVHINGHSSQK